MWGESICTCDPKGFPHNNDGCPWQQCGEIEFLNGTITIDTCRICHVLVSDFQEHWKAIHAH